MPNLLPFYRQSRRERPFPFPNTEFQIYFLKFKISFRNFKSLNMEIEIWKFNCHCKPRTLTGKEGGGAPSGLLRAEALLGIAP